MGQQYRLTIENQSTMSGDICVFQATPDLNVPGVLTLAWLAKRAHPGTTVAFTWSVDYNFVWSEQVVLKSGVKIVAAQVIDADLSDGNQVTFDHDGAYQFSEPTHGPQSGSLYIMQGPNVPPHGATVGIGMSGHGTFVVPSQPNVEVYFTPHPKYYVVFGDYEQGEVIDVSQMSQTVEAEFNGTTSVTLTLNAQNLWVQDSVGSGTHQSADASNSLI